MRPVGDLVVVVLSGVIPVALVQPCSIELVVQGLGPIAGHVLFALTHPGALRSMFRGWVTEAWARRHAAGWLAESEAGWLAEDEAGWLAENATPATDDPVPDALP